MSWSNAVKQIQGGAVTLSDSLKEANLGSLFDGIDLGTVFSRMNAVLSAARDYDNFSGKTDDMTGSVKFIYRSAEIK